MSKLSQHPTFNMVYNMLYDMFERFAPALMLDNVGRTCWTHFPWPLEKCSKSDKQELLRPGKTSLTCWSNIF